MSFSLSESFFDVLESETSKSLPLHQKLVPSNMKVFASIGGARCFATGGSLNRELELTRS